MSDASDRAKRNLEALRANPYPGRGLVVGMDESGRHLVQVYWIMGRSANSRNRVFENDGGHVWTAPADPSKVADPSKAAAPSLIIYNAMRELEGLYVATNGDQTDTVIQSALAGGDFRKALNTRSYEPDAPNFTPRIAASCSLRADAPAAELAVLKRSAFGDGCDRHYFRFEAFGAGLGHCVTTYMGDGNPLPSFQGEPFLLPLPGDVDAVATGVWQALNVENRVALAVKFLALSGGASTVRIINRNTKV